MPTLTIENAMMPHSLNPKQRKAWLKKYADAHTFRSQRMSQLTNAIETSDPIEEAEALNKLLFDPKAALASIVTANAKLPPKRRVTLEECETIASEINLNQAISEKVVVRAKAKPSGGTRIYTEFGIRHRARQDMIGKVMRPYYRPKPWQFGMRGVPDAIRTVQQRLSEGAVFVAHLDIVNFFGSFDFDQLPHELPLPQEVVEQAVLGRFMETVTDGTGGPHGYTLPLTGKALLSTARQGLPAGSCCAPIVADHCLSRLAWPLAKTAELANLVDNFFLMASTKAELEDLIAALHAAVEKLPGGYFKLHLIGQGKIARGCEFLGHRFSLCDGMPYTEPSVRNWEILNARLYACDEIFCKAAYGLKFKKPKLIRLKLAEMYAYASGWLNNFKLCNRIDEYRQYAMGSIEDMCKSQGLNLAAIKPLVEPFMDYAPTGYDFAG